MAAPTVFVPAAQPERPTVIEVMPVFDRRGVYFAQYSVLAAAPMSLPAENVGIAMPKVVKSATVVLVVVPVVDVVVLLVVAPVLEDELLDDVLVEELDDVLVEVLLEVVVVTA